MFSKPQIKNIMKKLFTFLIFVIIYSNSIAQVSQEWVRTYNGTVANGSDEGKRIETDKNGNIYISGLTTNLSTSYDYLTIKYDSLGIQQWVKVYNGIVNNWDIPTAMTLDKNGNVYVTGYSYNTENNSDYLTIKYGSNGIEQWSVRYDGPGNHFDWAYAIATDDSENVYVTGQCFGSTITNWDFGTVKYDKNGIQQWVAIFNGVGNTTDRAIEIKVDKNNFIYVTGDINKNNNYDFATVKYNSSGIQQWFAIYNGSTNGFDLPHSMDIDSLGNVYVTGSSDSVGTGYDCTTIKYNTNGERQWISKYNGTGNNEDDAIKVKVINTKNVCITGYSIGVDNTMDIVTMKYDSGGVLHWVSRYSSIGVANVIGIDIATDSAGNIYITGQSSDNCVTLKYNPSGIEQWVQIYSGISSDKGNSIAIDKQGNVYINGSTVTQNNGHDILTIKYSQSPHIRLSIKLLFEGYYSTAFNQLIRKDSVAAYLHQSIPPFVIIDSTRTSIDSISFTGLFKFINAPTGTYYVSVKHLNSIETWSKSGGEYLTNDGTLYNYDFTSASSQAYLNNLRLNGSKFCFYSGDVNQDGFVSLFDVIPVYNDAAYFATGNYLATDLTGDSIIDLTDVTLCYNNSVNFIRVRKPRE